MTGNIEKLVDKLHQKTLEKNHIEDKKESQILEEIIRDNLLEADQNHDNEINPDEAEIYNELEKAAAEYDERKPVYISPTDLPCKTGSICKIA